MHGIRSFLTTAVIRNTQINSIWQYKHSATGRWMKFHAVEVSSTNWYIVFQLLKKSVEFYRTQISLPCSQKRNCLILPWEVQTRHLYFISPRSFLGASAKKKKEVRSLASSLLSVWPSVRLHGTTGLTLDENSWDSIFHDFLRICQRNWTFIKMRHD